MTPLQIAERSLLLGGVACLAWPALAAIRAERFEDAARRELAGMVAVAARPDRPSAAAVPEQLLGLLDIPRIGLSVAVIEGEDAATLAVAAGHLAATPLPWQAGNAAIAGHRDTFFRPLQQVKVGDAVQLATLRGTFTYEVRRVRVVGPRDLSVLDPSQEAALTLITCYPFRYVGAAPLRFVVQAARTHPGPS